MDIHAEVIHGDITKMKVDAIVNAANDRLSGGGGVDGAIHKAGGPAIMEELDKIREEKGGCPTGQAVATGPGNLDAKIIIHTVGPVFKDGKQGEDEKLAEAYLNSLQLAEENNCESIAFPNISTGVYGYPKAAAAQLAIEAVKRYVKDEMPEDSPLDAVYFVCFDEENYKIYKNLLPTK